MRGATRPVTHVCGGLLAALLVPLGACGGGAGGGPQKIIATTPNPDVGGIDGGLDGGGGERDAGRISSSGGSEDGGASLDGGSSGGASADGGISVDGGGSPIDGGVKVCMADSDCAGSGPAKLPPCRVPRCLNNRCRVGPADDGAACDDGAPCTAPDTCQGGACAPGSFKCDDGNPCTDDTCDEASAVCGHGPASTDLLTQCDDGDPCTAGDLCAGGSCQGKAADCDDGNPCSDDACDPDKGCVHSPNTKPCGDSGKCYAKGHCVGGHCKSGDKLACDDGNDCTVDTCDAQTGTCTYAPGTKAQCDDGNACTKGDTCVLSGPGAGTCAPGAAPSCNDGNLCTDDACDPKTGLCAAVPNAAPCDDGNACTGKDACVGSVCQGGMPKLCDDADPCTDDACDPAKGCTATDNEATCADDAACKLGVCQQGQCVPGKQTGCDDNNPCTTDSCKQGGCVYAPGADGTVCKDGDKCRAKSLCAAGKCAPGAPQDCRDANPCTTDGCDPATGCAWQANAKACDDGDPCTEGDDCSTGKCRGATAADCDDGNACTADHCEAGKGCVHLPAGGGKPVPCDDGSVCTQDEVCQGGACGGGTQGLCEDGKECTVDHCDPGKGTCSWSAKSGPCDDGSECTAGDTCKAGKCVPGGESGCDDGSPCTVDSCDKAAGKCLHLPAQSIQPIPCDDGDLCTKNDTCVLEGKGAGQCTGGGGGPICDDGNLCTDDACDPATGKCGFSANTAACDAGNKCTWGDRCKNGKCRVGTNFSCDDGQACTTDSCDAKTGACSFAPLVDGAACDDGRSCSTGDACKAGKCVPKNDGKCAIYKETFECGGAGKGWLLHNTKGRKVVWAVDATPAVAPGAWGCSLNFNDGIDYCDPYAANKKVPCYSPTGIAWSPIIDGAALQGTPRLLFDTWYDLDPGKSDRPRVELRSDKNKYLYGFELDKGKSKQWRHMAVSVPQLKGRRFRVRFYLGGASGYGGNHGEGWFIDNLAIDQQYTAEVCTDGIDNDHNGQTDCMDLACKGKGACRERCDDAKDNDHDDKIDCADPDCAKALECTPPLFQARMDCGSGGWSFQDMLRNDVRFAIDADPMVRGKTAGGAPILEPPVTGKCTLNFNNGKNFCGRPDCKDGGDNANAGTATSGWIDATQYKSSLTLIYWSWIDAEPYGGNAYYDDRGMVQVSRDGFAGCCGATNACSSSSLNTCNKAGTSTWIAPRRAVHQRKWHKVVVNLYRFRGRKFQLRFRFNSGDGNKNSGSGWFIDDVRIYGK